MPDAPKSAGEEAAEIICGLPPVAQQATLNGILALRASYHRGEPMEVCFAAYREAFNATPGIPAGLIIANERTSKEVPADA